MLITFRSKAAGNITLFGDVAVALLRLMGQSGGVPGAIPAADVGRALNQLREGLKNRPAPPPLPERDERDDGERPERPVPLEHRAMPLIEFLERSMKANADVIWEKD